VHLRSTTPGRRRTALLLLVTGTALAALVAAAVPTYSIDTRHTGQLNNLGFPRHYTDDRGLQVTLCVDGSGRCQRADRGDLVPPEGEAFYWLATAHMRTQRGPLDVEFALEAAFAGQRPIVFDRIRIRGHLRQAGRYVLLHPYGRARFRAITPRQQRNVDFTVDRNCSLERNGRCNGRITNFLRAKNPPRGYLGFGGRRTQVKGGTARNSLILMTRKGNVIGRASTFAIVGNKVGRIR
jgi:hypothetical protein